MKVLSLPHKYGEGTDARQKKKCFSLYCADFTATSHLDGICSAILNKNRYLYLAVLNKIYNFVHKKTRYGNHKMEVAT